MHFHIVCKNKFMIYLQFKKFISNLLWNNTLPIFVVTQIMQMCSTKRMQSDFKAEVQLTVPRLLCELKRIGGLQSHGRTLITWGFSWINGEAPTGHFPVMHSGTIPNHCCVPISVTHLFHLLTSCQGPANMSQDSGTWLKWGIFDKALFSSWYPCGVYVKA